jgi:signal transduction histidine kinase
VIEDIVTRIDTLSNIVQDLLLFARPRPPIPIRVPFELLARDTIALLRNDPALVEVRVDVMGDSPLLMVDPELMKLVLLNLLINGAQAMQGRGRIVLQAISSDEWHEIRVSDHGPGIPPDVRARLFEPFFTTKHRGTGLGLATASRIAELHGGELDLQSAPDGGTIAEIRLPHVGRPVAVKA